MPLPTNFTDQIIDETQNLDRKYIPTLNDDNTYSFTDVTVYTDSGSKLTANHMNATNTQVNINTNKIGTESLHTTSQNLCGAINEHQQDIDDINNSLTEVSESVATVSQQASNINVYVGDDEKLHFVDKDGADSALPFSTKPTLAKVYGGHGSNMSWASTSTFTMEKDGYLIVNLIRDYESNAYVRVNNANVGSGTLIELKKNDVVTSSFQCSGYGSNVYSALAYVIFYK